MRHSCTCGVVEADTPYNVYHRRTIFRLPVKSRAHASSDTGVQPYPAPRVWSDTLLVL